MKELIRKILHSKSALVTIIFTIIIAVNFIYFFYVPQNGAESNNILTEDQKLYYSNILRNQLSYIDERISALITIAIISLMLFSISIFINKKPKVKTYRKETSDLISPIISESIIDGKIGLKELIMTTIIELNIKGNINIINNDTLELVSLKNLENYELDIAKMLFKQQNIIKFSDINNIFAESDIKTLGFTQKLTKIKDLLFEKIDNMKMFSRKLTIVNKIIQLIAILISVNLPLLFFNDYDISALLKISIIINAFIIIFYIKNIKKNNTIQEKVMQFYSNELNSSLNFVFVGIVLIFIIIFMFINIAKYHFIFFISTVLVFILNLYTIHKCKSIALSKKGREEQIKLLELKKYINDYSLIKNRDLESVIIWDEYLAYATAFGIPNNVTNKIYEKWYKMNLNLQLIDKLFNSNKYEFK